MKYIKQFESFEGESVDDTVKDICLELIDLGYEVNYNESPSKKKRGDKGGFEIIIRKQSITYDRGESDKKVTEIKIEGELKEVIERLRDYLGDNLVKMQIYIMEGLCKSGNLLDSGWYNLNTKSKIDQSQLEFTINGAPYEVSGIISISLQIRR